MSVVADYLLRAKHWQIFVLLFGTFCVALSAESLGIVGLLSWVALALAEICFLFWLWSLGSFFGSIVPPALRLNKGLFLFALVYAPVYLFAFNVFFQDLRPLMLVFVFPLHLLAMFCMVYSFYFVSKSLMLAERGDSISFRNYAGLFFLIWFFPIGVWVVQPRANLLYADKKNTGERNL